MHKEDVKVIKSLCVMPSKKRGGGVRKGKRRLERALSGEEYLDRKCQEDRTGESLKEEILYF